jgi:SAM-dependent methyltransferase
MDHEKNILKKEKNSMSKQNIYDSQNMFDGYKELRNSNNNANVLVEKPAMLSLLPDLLGKHVLDLGCGFGEHCKEYKKLGAKRIVGIDISTKMLAIAKSENHDKDIEYINLPMEDIDKLNMKFDIVCSSLAFHYVKDLKDLILKVYNILNNDGVLIFTQEHPLATSYSDTKGPRWEKDETGTKICARLFDYCIEGERHSRWLTEDVIKYHRTFSTILTTLTESGFMIEKVLEPILNEEEMTKHPEYKDNYHRPDFLLIKAQKRCIA